ncbi:MAG: sigma-70 family RNA polymerase sigma factor [Puia sp.]|nr:sigma-70 family RNA polymerase sigma factor [Puia sp.]
MTKTANEKTSTWLQFKNGDREAFASLYQQHIHALIAYGCRLCADREILKDTIHELFVELWNSRDNLSPTDSVKFYLFKALRYKLLRLEKRHRDQDRSAGSVADHLYKHFDHSIETAIVEKEEFESHTALVRKAVKRLTLRQQEVIQLRYYQGFSNEQIATLMDMHYQSVSNLLYNALSRLKEAIKVHDLIASLLAFAAFFG